VARAAGMREATVSLGVDELEAGAEPLGGLDPGLRPALLALVEPDERGDPMSPLRWTTKSIRNLAAELTRLGHKVSADTVGDILRAEGFSLQGNAKTLEGKQHPDPRRAVPLHQRADQGIPGGRGSGRVGRYQEEGAHRQVQELRPVTPGHGSNARCVAGPDAWPGAGGMPARDQIAMPAQHRVRTYEHGAVCSVCGGRRWNNAAKNTRSGAVKCTRCRPS
jgi:hypothetical protein